MLNLQNFISLFTKHDHVQCYSIVIVSAYSQRLTMPYFILIINTPLLFGCCCFSAR